MPAPIGALLTMRGVKEKASIQRLRRSCAMRGLNGTQTNTNMYPAP